MTNNKVDQDDFIASMESISGDAKAMQSAVEKVAALAFWRGKVDPEPLKGGASNINLTVVDQGKKYAVRVSDDNEATGVDRVNEVRAIEAAGNAGVGPKILHHEPGIIVTEFIEGRSLKPIDLDDECMLDRVAQALRHAHYDIPKHLTGVDFCLWPPHHCRWYLKDSVAGSDDLPTERFGRVPELLALTDDLETVIGAVNIVFGHNDMMPQNVMDTGDRIVFVDWEYAGFGADLFDLGGLMMNANIGDDLMRTFLSSYYDSPADDTLWRRFTAMMIMAAIREGAWSMLMETQSMNIDFDFGAYSTMCLRRVDRLVSRYRVV